MIKDRYGVVVAGAGPAGIMAARAAAAYGTVLLCESGALPRYKSCGGMLNEHAQDFLSSLAKIPGELLLDPDHVCFRYVDWDRRIVKPTTLRFVNVLRSEFDEWLLTLLPSSVELAADCPITACTQLGDGVRVELSTHDGPRTVECSYVIGADGARSSVRRAIGASRTANYVTLQDWVSLRGELPTYFDCIYMRAIGDCYAYSYVVPKGERAIVGSVFYPRTKRPLLKHETVLEVLKTDIPQIGETREREASSALCVRSASDVVPGAGRVLLAGEAGGFMSPTSGEGISYAMNTGSLAGQAVAESGNGHALEAYRAATRHISRNISRKLRWLPVMESAFGKYAAGFVPTAIVDRVTHRL